MRHKIPLKEIKRKSIHITFGILILLMIYFTGTQTSALVIATGIILGTIISLWIKKGKKFIFFKEVVEKVERENEKNFPGKAAVMFFVSALILLIFSQLFLEGNTIIVLAALNVQVFADASAALIGITFGKHKLYKKKTYEGSIACLIVAIICLSVFYPLWIAIMGAIIATAVEILPLDDNLWVPIFTATTLKALI